MAEREERERDKGRKGGREGMTEKVRETEKKR